jgi:hypothetical protein
MIQTFMFDKLAVIVMPWREPMTPPERGARLEVRRLGDEPHRGSRYAAQKFVIDDPLFRADLFDQMNHPVGNLKSAHFHPKFNGVEPVDRVWPDELKRDAVAWLTAELSDLASLLARAGVFVEKEPELKADVAAVRDATPTIVAAVEATWAAVRAEPV